MKIGERAEIPVARVKTDRRGKFLLRRVEIPPIQGQRPLAVDDRGVIFLPQNVKPRYQQSRHKNHDERRDKSKSGALKKRKGDPGALALQNRQREKNSRKKKGE